MIGACAKNPFFEWQVLYVLAYYHRTELTNKHVDETK